MFHRVGKLTKLNDVSDAHAKAGHKHPCSEPQEVGFNCFPQVGERWGFCLYGRVYSTSHIKKVELYVAVSVPAVNVFGLEEALPLDPPHQTATYTFETSNSRYELIVSELDIYD